MSPSNTTCCLKILADLCLLKFIWLLCVETVKIDTPSHVYTGTVCFQCTTYQGLVKEDATFSIANETASSIDGAMVVNGTLVITMLYLLLKFSAKASVSATKY